MSESRIVEVSCPDCKAAGQFTVWQLINVNEDQRLREMVLNDGAFFYTCPHCGAKSLIPHEAIYLDSTHHFVIFLIYNPASTDKIQQFPLADIASYTLRIVDSPEALKEKIRILELGLNDVAMERLKFMYRYVALPEELASSQLYFHDITYEDEPLRNKGQLHFIVRGGHLNGINWFLPIESYYEHCLACRMDPRMTATGCQQVDELWIARKFKSEAL